MGNHLGNNVYYGGSKEKISEQESLLERLDYIVSNYILTMDFNSLKKLYDKNYCNKLVGIASDIFDKYFTDLEIEKIYKTRLNENTQDVKKMEACKKIASFYIKIAHVFSAIVTTINPEYVYTSESGNFVKRKLYEKEKIPMNTKMKLSKSNFCGKRIDILKKGIEKENPFCYFNFSQNGDIKTLNEEPGIPELMHLYYDDDFDYKTGNFSSMSEDSREQFIKDLHSFYKEFTGEDNVPSNVTKFSDIKLKNYASDYNCSINNTPIDKTLFTEYANNLKQMIVSAKDQQEKLLQTIHKIFISVNGSTGNQYIRIHPHLTDQELQKIIENARQIIVELYLKCEADFTNGLQMYEAIIESRIFNTTQMQIKNLQKSQELFVEGLNNKSK
jgi:hypothetical protein